MLTETQRAVFFERGMLRVPGVLPKATVDAMVCRIWRGFEEIHGMWRDDRTTWIEGGVRGIGDLNKEPEFRPCVSPTIEAIADDLLGKGCWRRPASWGQILATFPAREWSWNSLFQGQVDVEQITWHTDFPYDTPPDQLMGVQVFCLLADIGPGGGATLVIERSHQLIRKFVLNQSAGTLKKMKRARQTLMRSDPWLKSVSKAVSSARPEPWLEKQTAIVNDVPVKVRELIGNAGDVYFTHPWLLHAISPNCNETPRLMCTQRIHRLD